MSVLISLDQVQALTGGVAPIRVPMVQLQVIPYSGTFNTYLSLNQLQALLAGSPNVRVAATQLQVLLPAAEIRMPAIYPQLIGLTYSVIKRPIWASSIGTAAGGAETRIGFFQYPLWEFDLAYDILWDYQTDNSTTASDIRTLMGFYNGMYGNLMAFFFQDTDDYQVVGQEIGIGDGTTTNFTFCRTFGADGFGIAEPVGGLNTSQPVNIYINGVEKTLTTDYVLNTATPMANVVAFGTAPAAGAVITADFQYYFWVRFLDPKYDWEKFASQMWAQKKITLRSLRAN